MPASAVNTITNAAMISVPVRLGHRRKDQVHDVAAGAELVAGDGRVGEQNRDGPQHARRRVVAGFQQIGNGELRELARTRRDESK